MKIINPSRSVRAGVGAALLALSLVGPTLALSWSAPTAFTTSGDAVGGGVAATGTSSAVAVYDDSGRIYVRRTTDSGATWTSRLRLSTDGYESAIAARGAKVDVVWISNNRVRYARSTNGGASFAAPVALSPSGGGAEMPSVARGPDGRVAVVWNDWIAGKVRVRVSTDGGSSFRKAKTLVTSMAWGPMPSVAIGKGVIYVAYYIDETRLRMRRSTDSGTTWAAAVTVTNGGFDYAGSSLTAAGTQAYIGYTVFDSTGPRAMYRRTTDKGKSWSSAAQLAGAGFQPQLALQGGVVRAVFGTCDANCEATGLKYRQSADGISFTAAETLATPSTTVFEWPDGLTFAGRVIVISTSSTEVTADVQVRTGKP
jgi:hypothetical protein